MSLRFISIKRALFAVFVCALVSVSAASAQNVIEKLVSPGEISDAHKDQKKTCNACHASFDKGAQTTLCLDCHEDVAKDISAGIGFHGRAPDIAGAACKTCHTEHKGAAFKIVEFDEEQFDHALTDYSLNGVHREVACVDCHEEGKKFRDAPHDCVDCHKSDEPHKGRLGNDCQSCHVVEDWKKVEFDHQETSFPLLGSHRTVRCAACHLDEVYEGLPGQCVDCHEEEDAHKGAFGADCESCHQPSSWATISFDHGRNTGFNLTGKHARADCAACHVETLFQPELDARCISCHRKDDAHKGRNGPSCADCHGTTSWKESSFQHDRDTGFSLRGAHASVSCEGCHADSVTARLPGKACIDCHRSDDPHKGVQGEDCASCHNEISWTEGLTFDHDLSGFPLLGKHEGVECAACHASKAFSDTPTECAACHLEDDKHDGALGEDCSLCHTPATWSFWMFDHDSQTDFKLEGKHRGLICSACHKPDRSAAQEQSSECISCHRADDKHHGQFGGDCGRCHTTSSFSTIRLN